MRRQAGLVTFLLSLVSAGAGSLQWHAFVQELDIRHEKEAQTSTFLRKHIQGCDRNEYRI